jgi:ferredoxin
MTIEQVISKEDQIYRDLQIHIDSQALTYPALKSGAEIRVLKHLFNPEEAKIALYLTYKYENIDVIFERAKESGISKEDLETILERLVIKGAIGYREKNGINQYQIWGFAIGFYEGQVYKLTPEFIHDVSEMTDDLTFGIGFISAKPAQWRTIPIEQSVTSEHKVASFDELEKLVMNTKGPIGVVECICRQSKHIQGEPCKVTSRLETCIAFGDMVAGGLKRGIGREISKEEALEIFRKNQDEGLVLNSSNAIDTEFICSCCGCCCGMLSAHQKVPDPSSFWINNFHAEIDSELCAGCQTCVDRCQTGAIRFRKKTNISTINEKKCIGCGNCVAVCPEEAIQLVKAEVEYIPPQTVEDLYDEIKSNR